MGRINDPQVIGLLLGLPHYITARKQKKWHASKVKYFFKFLMIIT